MIIDFKLLKEQRQVINTLLAFNRSLTTMEKEALEGVINLLDALCDAIEADDGAHEGGAPIMLVHSRPDKTTP